MEFEVMCMTAVLDSEDGNKPYKVSFVKRQRMGSPRERIKEKRKDAGC